MKFDKLVNKILNEAYSDYDLDPEGRVKPYPTTNLVKGPFTLVWKDEEYGKSRVWYKANSLNELVNKVNKDNMSLENAKCVWEEHEFQSQMDLIEFCQPETSNFIILDGNNKPVGTEIR